MYDTYNVGCAIIGILILLVIIVGLYWFFARPTPTPVFPVRRFSSQLSGGQEVPPVATDGSGSGNVTLAANRNSLAYEFRVENLSSPATAAHFHRGAQGVNGPVVKTLNLHSLGHNNYRLTGTWTSTDTSEPLTNSLVQDLLNNNIYINVHTTDYPNGEIRSQVTPLLT